MIEAGTESGSGRWLALVAAGVSGVAVYVNGEVVGRFSSATVYTTGKNLVAGLLLVMLAIALPHLTGSPATDDTGGDTGDDADRTWSTRERLGLAAVALIGGAVPFVLFFEGLARATSSDAAFLHKTLVVWVAVFAVWLLGERLTALHVGAIALLIAGQVALAGGIGSLRIGVGEAMILAATICWAVELIVVKRLVEGLPSTTVGAARIGGGAALLVVWLLLSGRLGALVSLSMSQWAWLVVTGGILSVFVTVWFAAVARAPVIDAAALLVPAAVITGLIRLAAAGNTTPIQVVGWSLMLLGVAAVLAGRRDAGAERGERRAIGAAA